MLNTDGFKHYITLHNEIKELTTKVDKLKKEKEEIKYNLIDNLSDEEMKKISFGNSTVYIHEQVWANVLDKEKAIELLKLKYDGYIKENFNSQQLSALIREYIKEEDKLPKEFEGIIDYVVKTDLRVKA